MASDRIEKFRRMVAAHPRNELALYSLGSALLDEGRHAEAETLLARALEIRGDWVMAHILRARCLIALGRPDEARALLVAGRAHSIAQRHQGPVDEIDALLGDLQEQS